MEWHTVYDLSNDNASVMKIQRATRETADYGFLPEIALFGSPKWWEAVRDGRIPTYTVAGFISKVNENIRGAWPVCEVNSDGEKTEWTREGYDAAYQVGRRIYIEYVYQRGKSSKVWKGLNNRMKVVLKIAIEY